MKLNNGQQVTHGIVHTGLRGLRGFVARKKSRYKLIGNRLVLPHDTIPSTVGCKPKKRSEQSINLQLRIYHYF